MQVGPEYRLPVSSLAKYIDFTRWEPDSDASYYTDGKVLVKGPVAATRHGMWCWMHLTPAVQNSHGKQSKASFLNPQGYLVALKLLDPQYQHSP